MQVQFRCIPKAIFQGDPGILPGIGSHIHRLDQTMGIEPVLAVAVFTLNIVSNDHQRLKPPDLLNLPLCDTVIAMVVSSFLEAHGVKIPGSTHNRIMPDTHFPQTVQTLMISEGFVIVIRHKGGLNSQLLFHGIIADHTTEKEHIVIRVGGKGQNIRLFTGRQPVLHTVRRQAVCIHTQLDKGMIPLFFEHKRKRLHCFRQPDIVMEEALCAAVQAAPIPHQRKRAGMAAPFDIQRGEGFLAFNAQHLRGGKIDRRVITGFRQLPGKVSSI